MSIYSRKPLLKILVLGDIAVGKTSLINQYVNRKFTVSHRRTVGSDFSTKDVFIDGKAATLQIWDTVGQERFSCLNPSFYRRADCVILVYDVKLPSTFKNLKLWKEEFVNSGAPNDPENFPFVVIANKIDLGIGLCHENRSENVLNCNYKVPYYETSAMHNINVDEAFSMAAKMALEREGGGDYYNSISLRNLSNRNKKHGKCHC